MKTLGGGRWGDHAWVAPRANFASFVFENYPDSNYALFVVPYLKMPARGEPDPVFDRLIRKYASHSFTEQLRLLRAEYHIQALQVARALKDWERAATQADAAHAIAADLMRTARSQHVRAYAQKLSQTTPTRKQLLRR